MIKHINKKFLSKKKTNCNFCNSEKLSIWAKKSFFKVNKCNNCGLVFVNPFLNQKGLDLFYKGYFKKRQVDKKSKKQRYQQYELDKNFLLNNINGGPQSSIIAWNLSESSSI